MPSGPPPNHHRLVDAVAVHVLEPLRHHPAAGAHVALLAGVLVFVERAPGLRLHQVDRPPRAFEHDIVELVVALHFRGEVAELGREVFGPERRRRGDVHVGIDDIVGDARFRLEGTVDVEIGFGHVVSPGLLSAMGNV